MQPVRLDVTSAQEGRSVSFTLTAAEANDWRSGRLDAHGLSRMAVERVLARPGDTVTLAYGDSLFRPAVMCDGSGSFPSIASRPVSARSSSAVKARRSCPRYCGSTALLTHETRS